MTPAFVLSSPGFTPDGSIPSKYTCDGTDHAPPLAWGGAPAGTKSFALVVDDPDAPDPAAPKTTWVHWVVYNIPAAVDALLENASRRRMPAGAKEGLNDWKRPGYQGPCPPIGRHRYFHKVYALDTTLPDLGPVTKSQLEAAMRGHVLERAELIGTYQRSASPNRS